MSTEASERREDAGSPSSGSPAGVAVVGAINVDFIVVAPRLPAPGETVVGGGLQRHGGGKGANAAVAAARAGASVHLVGAVGADDNGASALQELRAEGIDVHEVAVLEDHTTGVALIVVSTEGENQIAVGPGANAAVSAEHVRRALERVLSDVGCVLVSTEIAPSAVVAAVETATAAGVLCILNPAPVIPEVLGLLDAGPLLTPNASESADLAALIAQDGGEPTTSSAGDADTGSGRARRAAICIVQRTSSPVIVTLGADGALVLCPDAAMEHVPPRPASVRDTTGAGDTFNGVLATRLAAGDPLAAAVRAATVAASLSVAHVGARDGMPRASLIHTSLAPA
jgi:ribokinase